MREVGKQRELSGLPHQPSQTTELQALEPPHVVFRTKGHHRLSVPNDRASVGAALDPILLDAVRRVAAVGAAAVRELLRERLGVRDHRDLSVHLLGEQIEVVGADKRDLVVRDRGLGVEFCSPV